MLPIQPEHNYAACGGPLHCRYCAAILTESGERRCERITAEDRARRLRTACAKPDYCPDPYAKGIEALRRELPPPTRWPDPPTPSSSSPRNFTPPDPYAKALDQMKKGTK